MIQPTVGRVVWFHPSTSDQELGRFLQAHEGKPFAAIVTHVWSDAMVNLCVFDPNGVPHPRTSVQLVQPEEHPDHRPAGHFCEWMPYQKGQAAKTEASEKAATQTTGETIVARYHNDATHPLQPRYRAMADEIDAAIGTARYHGAVGRPTAQQK